MYNKLFSKIVTSSVWLSPTDHRIVWITFLALMDKDGYVPMASVANLAHTARVTPEAAEAAVKAFESPDPFDPEQEFQGRRIERVSGGWQILNARKYQEMATADKIREQSRLRNQAYRARKTNANVTQRDVTVTHATQNDANDENVTTSGSVSVSQSESERRNPPTPLIDLSDSEWRRQWNTIRADYPNGTYRQSNWLEAEREARRAVDEGLCTCADWLDAVRRYAAQMAAKAQPAQYVQGPNKWFHREARSWMEPFPLPVAEPDGRHKAIDADAKEWERLKEKAAVLGFRAPWPVESTKVYETAMRAFERDRPPSGTNGAHLRLRG